MDANIPGRPPDVEDGIADVLVRRIGECSLVRCHARGCTERERASAGGVLGAPVRDLCVLCVHVAFGGGGQP